MCSNCLSLLTTVNSNFNLLLVFVLGFNWPCFSLVKDTNKYIKLK
jgi:hypothetical protein